MRDCLLFFVRHPEPGRVKTRMIGPARPELVADFYAAMVEGMLDRLDNGLGADLIVCFTPATRVEVMRAWLGPNRRFLAQRGRDLGERMANAFRDAFALGYDRAVLTGSDIPGLTPSIVRQGLDALAPGRAALGPAEDGGYFLAGFYRDGFVPALFDEAQWGGSRVYARALERLAAADMDAAVLDRLADLDTVDDLRAMLDSPGCPLAGRALALARKLVGR
ncbi:TIGR04282 family arsenosugar biosynthesis glycosyltransferase [Pseudodesulfovibrio methanolicus]|uniref:TIGR04282 family arsenosugar biosynthesis glycosyltransferase n=1 Tax=Pseudodesulfovibrio methanolicus TaxID=3126690 RepID=A0ABZ2IZT1_9BACT